MLLNFNFWSPDIYQNDFNPFSIFYPQDQKMVVRHAKSSNSEGPVSSEKKNKSRQNSNA